MQGVAADKCDETAVVISLLEWPMNTIHNRHVALASTQLSIPGYASLLSKKVLGKLWPKMARHYVSTGTAQHTKLVQTAGTVAYKPQNALPWHAPVDCWQVELCLPSITKTVNLILSIFPSLYPSVKANVWLYIIVLTVQPSWQYIRNAGARQV
jgi:hypothetical protein